MHSCVKCVGQCPWPKTASCQCSCLVQRHYLSHTVLLEVRAHVRFKYLVPPWADFLNPRADLGWSSQPAIPRVTHGLVLGVVASPLGMKACLHPWKTAPWADGLRPVSLGPAACRPLPAPLSVSLQPVPSGAPGRQDGVAEMRDCL